MSGVGLGAAGVDPCVHVFGACGYCLSACGAHEVDYVAGDGNSAGVSR